MCILSSVHSPCASCVPGLITSLTTRTLSFGECLLQTLQAQQLPSGNMRARVCARAHTHTYTLYRGRGRGEVGNQVIWDCLVVPLTWTTGRDHFSTLPCSHRASYLSLRRILIPNSGLACLDCLLVPGKPLLQSCLDESYPFRKVQIKDHLLHIAVAGFIAGYPFLCWRPNRLSTTAAGGQVFSHAPLSSLCSAPQFLS